MDTLTLEDIQDVCHKIFAQTVSYSNPFDEIMVGFGEFIPKDTAYRLGDKLKIDGRVIVLLSSDILGVFEESEMKVGYSIRRVPEDWVRLFGELMDGSGVFYTKCLQRWDFFIIMVTSKNKNQ